MYRFFNLWSEAVSEQIFYLVIRQMQEIIEFWDKSPANGKALLHKDISGFFYNVPLFLY